MPHPINRLAKLMSMLAVTLAMAGCAQPTSTTTQAVVAPAPATREEHQVFFATDSATIDAKGQAVVASIAAVAAKDEAVSVRVIGKTDRVGSPPVNMALSKRRTEAVLAALLASGVPKARIDWGWVGERQPEVATADEKGEPRNRMVEISVAREPR
jgi:OOP family OmpA-OmpF porin